MSESTKITYDYSATASVIMPLVDFNFIIDTDFGLMLLIDREYLDKSVFSIDFFNSHRTVQQMTEALYTRKDPNPLSIAINPEYKEDIDELYKEFMESEYEKILQLSRFTDAYIMVNNLNMQLPNSVTIICENQAQMDLLDTVQCKINKVLYENIEKIRRGNQLMFKRFDHPAFEAYIPNMWENSVYIANYPFNESTDIESEYVMRSVAVLYEISEKRCKLLSIDLYNVNSLREEE